MQTTASTRRNEGMCFAAGRERFAPVGEHMKGKRCEAGRALQAAHTRPACTSPIPQARSGAPANLHLIKWEPSTRRAKPWQRDERGNLCVHFFFLFQPGGRCAETTASVSKDTPLRCRGINILACHVSLPRGRKKKENRKRDDDDQRPPANTVRDDRLSGLLVEASPISRGDRSQRNLHHNGPVFKASRRLNQLSLTQTRPAVKEDRRCCCG